MCKEHTSINMTKICIFIVIQALFCSLVAPMPMNPGQAYGHMNKMMKVNRATANKQLQAQTTAATAQAVNEEQANCILAQKTQAFTELNQALNQRNNELALAMVQSATAAAAPGTAPALVESTDVEKTVNEALGSLVAAVLEKQQSALAGCLELAPTAA